MQVLGRPNQILQNYIIRASAPSHCPLYCLNLGHCSSAAIAFPPNLFFVRPVLVRTRQRFLACLHDDVTLAGAQRKGPLCCLALFFCSSVRISLPFPSLLLFAVPCQCSVSYLFLFPLCPLQTALLVVGAGSSVSRASLSPKASPA